LNSVINFKTNTADLIGIFPQRYSSDLIPFHRAKQA